jgi:hypothetical protein
MSTTMNFPALKPTLNLDFANVKALDPRITFTRASEGRYFDGRTFAKAEENLLLQSQDFTTTWTNAASTDTANTSVAPDGTTTADTLTASATTAAAAVIQTISAGGQTSVTSVFAKKGTHRYIQIRWATDVASFVNFDIEPAAGAVGSVGGNATGLIVDAGNGWYRCIAVNTTTTTLTQVAVNFVTSTSAVRNQSATWAGTETVILWGAQLEQRSSVTAYTPTTTAPITNYIPVLQTAAANVARFDHNPATGESLGLLIEEQRTNLLLRSAEFNDAAWVGPNRTITANTAIAPDGALTADKAVSTAVSGQHAVNQFVTTAPNASYSFSLYVKAAEYAVVRLLMDKDGAFVDRITAEFNVSTGVITSAAVTAGSASGASAAIVSVGNGWFRCTISGTLSSTAGTSVRCVTYINGDGTYTGDDFSGIYIWGAQLEAGAFPTSHIPTVASQVTRQADAASMTGVNFSSWYRQDAFTVVSEFRRDTTANTAAGGGNSVPRVYAFGTSAAAAFQLRLFSASSAEVTGPSLYMASNWAAGQYERHATAYAVNDAAISRNGLTVVSDSTVDAFAPDMFSIGQNTSGIGNIGQGWIRSIRYYPSRLANSVLQALTS